MSCIKITNGFLCIADVTEGAVTVNGKKHKFEFDDRFGPLWVRKDGFKKKHQNPPKAVWTAFQRWLNKREIKS